MSRHPRRARRPAAAPARGPAARAALDRRARHDRVRRRLPREAPRLHASARTCSSPTCPSGSPPTASWRRSGRCRASSAASARRRASAPRGCSSRSARRSCRPRRSRPSWRRSGPTSCATRRSRCPNLLMMDCERYGANVFEVIDLINRDYPRGGIALPGLHRRHVPAQGLRVLARSAVERARHAARASRACNESVPLFLVEGVKRRLGDLRERKVAVLGLAFKARHRRRARLALAQADPPARARAGRRRRPRPGRGDADGSASRRPSTRRRRRRRGDEPHRVLERPRRCAAIAEHGRRRTASSSTPGTRSAPPRCSPTRARSPR